jgi:hypothetical protein
VIKNNILYKEPASSFSGGGGGSADDDWYEWDMSTLTNTGAAPTSIMDDIYTGGTVMVGDVNNQNGRVWVTGSDDTPIITATNTNNGNVSMGVSAETQGSTMSIAGSFHAHDGAQVNYGVFAQCGLTAMSNYAGYFAGDVYSTMSFVGSDRKLKENIQDYSGAMDKLLNIGVKSYNFKEDYSFMGFDRKNHVGVIAQELKEVFPEFVKTTYHPAEFDDEGIVVREEVEFLTVSYESLIPVLVKGMQEQQAEIESLKEELLSVQENKSNKSGTGINSSVDLEIGLAQNRPNPFSERTIIGYTIPEESMSGQILIFNMNGMLIRTFDLPSNKKGEITIEGSELDAGMYIYTLMADGQEMDTKRMILTK